MAKNMSYFTEDVMTLVDKYATTDPPPEPIKPDNSDEKHLTWLWILIGTTVPIFIIVCVTCCIRLRRWKVEQQTKANDLVYGRHVEGRSDLLERLELDKDELEKDELEKDELEKDVSIKVSERSS